jgi:putative DNA primase/helicase
VGLRENDSDAWSPIQHWLLRLRRRGISVLIVHHAGTRGGQRGSADNPRFRGDRIYAVCVRRLRCRREDVLDTSLCLRRPGDYAPAQGARFEDHIEKARGIHGEDAKPFEARLATADGTAAWSMRDVEDPVRLRVAGLLAAGMAVRKIAEEIGIGKSAVHRMKQRIDREAKEAAAGEDEANSPARALSLVPRV